MIVSPDSNSTIFLVGNAVEKNGGPSSKPRPRDFIDLLMSALPLWLLSGKRRITSRF
jgi:hypothetical protein